MVKHEGLLPVSDLAGTAPSFHLNINKVYVSQCLVELISAPTGFSFVENGQVKISL